MMPRVFALLLAVALVCTSIIAVPSTDAQAAAQIKLSAKKQTLYVGGNFTLKATGKAAKKVSYKSDKPGIASVNKKGKVTAKSKGTAKITVTSKTNKKAKATCKVTVKEGGVKKIETASKLVMQKGKSVTLNLGFTPSNAANAKAKQMKFSTNKKKIATVSAKGVIKAKKTGTAKITVQPKDNSAKKVTVTVTVKKKITPVKKITLNKTAMSLTVGGASEKLTATLSPKKPTSKALYWVSDNTNVATVNVKNGTVTAVGNGTAKITAYATDSSKKKATCTVNVTTAPTAIRLDPAALNLTAGGEQAIVTAIMDPETVSPEHQVVAAWASSDMNVATVTPVAEGATQAVVTPLAAGTTVITATAANGVSTNEVTSCIVTVTASGQVGTVFTLSKAEQAYKVKVPGRAEKTISMASVEADYENFVNSVLNANYTGDFVAEKWDKLPEKLNTCASAKELYDDFLAEMVDGKVKVTAGNREAIIERTENDGFVVTAGKKTVEITNLVMGPQEGESKVITANVEATSGSSKQKRSLKVVVTKAGITVSRTDKEQEQTLMTIVDSGEAYIITVYPDSRDDLNLVGIDYENITVVPVSN